MAESRKNKAIRHYANSPKLNSSGVYHLNELLTPGVYVRHPDEPEWGIGQVQSNVDGRITVNFEHRGKQVINGEKIRLSIAQPED